MTLISFDWEEDGKPWHLEGCSTDGRDYTGTYGSPKVDPNCTFELRLSMDGADRIFEGTYTENNQRDIWRFRIHPHQ
jgi:hypothetical protein